MAEAPSERPRPGPIRLLLVVAASAVLLALAFAALMAAGWRNGAAVLLLAPPLADLARRRRQLAGYVARHTGGEATGYTLVALWSAGLAAVFGAGTAPGPVWIAATAGAIAAVAAAVERVLWARFPVQLAAHGLPATDRSRKAFRWFDRSSEPFDRFELALTVLLIVTQLLTATLLIGDPAGGVAVGGAAVSLGFLAVKALSSLIVALGRIVSGDRVARATIGPDVAALAPRILIHFSGSIHTLYQLDQWMPYIVSSGHPALLVAREDPTFRAVAGRWAIPVAFIDEFPDLDLVVSPSARLALYVNTGTKNNQLVRFDNLLHIQLHHGDSDKPPSSGKTLRLYDHHFVAGEAARDRLMGPGLVPSSENISIVGRPVTDPLSANPPGNDRPTVLYAPTWEGFHLDSALSSVALMGAELIRRLPASFNVIVRPHPLTGTVDRRLRPILRDMRQAVAHRGAGNEWVDAASGPTLIDCMNRADILLCDVSSVLVDFLATDRPIIVSDVAGLGAAELHRRYPSTSGSAVIGRDLDEYVELLATLIEEDPDREERRAAQRRLLASVGAAEQAFHETLEKMLE